MPHSDYSTLAEEVARTRKGFSHPLLIIKPTATTQIAQTSIPHCQHQGQRD